MTDERKSQPDLPNRQRRRWLLAGLVINGLIGLACVGWLITTGRAAQTDLTAARTAASQLRADLSTGNIQEATKELVLIQRRAASARRSTSGFIWNMAARIPFAGRPVRTAQGVAAAADTLARTVLPLLTDAAQALHPNTPLASSDTVNIAAVHAAAGPLADAASHLATVSSQLDTLPTHTGIARLDRARVALTQQTTQLERTTSTSATAARLLPPMLGADGPRRYFLALQTNAEARGTGGLVGAFSMLVADHGHIGLQQFTADDAIPEAAKPVISLGPDFDHRYGEAQSTQLLADSNLSPHYPYAARIWTRLWQDRTGQQLDGAIATDPVGLADLLAATGPISLPAGPLLTASNAVAYTERDLYTQYPDAATRKQALTQVADSVANALAHQHLNPLAILKALSTSASNGHLRVWSSHPEEEQHLADTILGGVLPDTSRPFAELVINNAAASKLDYYLVRRLEYQLGTCKNGSRPSTVRIQLTNTAPRSGLPDYVVNRSDDPGHPHIRGSNFSWVSFYATRGAQLVGASLDSQPQLMSVDEERDHTVLSTTMEILPGRTRVLDLHLLEPASDAAPLMPTQPLARGQTTTLSTQSCRAG
ncbi:DUF4012 domain-containing protein [Streptantibioticus ferralitis]|uniref:DUF4012 domain-containing protein n=1 Tax=Streptantibioticus ferralitis TaxID=236510 RepID=A0ABT5Z0U8_9ACTN|nr:DUF4012 domain-containing protein [Streptantibioticus ferralitis]MDF2257457.1 DUF4012 domain-containing protein [Streptantibioticus ferralitis]